MDNPDSLQCRAYMQCFLAPTALNPLSELFTAVEQVRVQLSRSPASAKPWSQLLWTGDGLATGPSLTTPNVPGVPQVTLDAIEVIGRLLLDVRGMLMHQKFCPATICGAPVALQHSSEGPFQAIVPDAIAPPQLTSFNMAVADFFGATNVVQQSWTDRDIEPIKNIFFCIF